MDTDTYAGRHDHHRHRNKHNRNRAFIRHLELHSHKRIRMYLGPTADIVILPAPSLPAVPEIDTIIQPTCNVSTGSVVLTGLPASGTWTLTRYPGGTTFSGSGISTTITGLQQGTYYFTVTNPDGCTSSRINQCGYQSAAPNTRSAGTGSHHPPDLPGARRNGSAERSACHRHMDTYPLTGQHNLNRDRHEYYCFRPRIRNI